MRISDWSSDVCSSDLPYPFALVGAPRTRFDGPMLEFPYQSSMAATNLILSGALDAVPDLNVCISHGGGFFPYQFGRVEAFAQQIGRASCRERVCQYV